MPVRSTDPAKSNQAANHKELLATIMGGLHPSISMAAQQAGPDSVSALMALPACQVLLSTMATDMEMWAQQLKADLAELKSLCLMYIRSFTKGFTKGFIKVYMLVVVLYNNTVYILLNKLLFCILQNHMIYMYLLENHPHAHCKYYCLPIS